MSLTEIKPFLISKDSEGRFALTVRETRYNSQGYPWVLKTAIEQTFSTGAAARAYAMAQLNAKPGEFAAR